MNLSQSVNKEIIKDFPNSIVMVSPRGRVYTVVGVGYPLCDLFCDCRGFSFRGDCSHVQEVRKSYEYNRDLRKN